MRSIAHFPRGSRNRGFTLLELVLTTVVVAVIAIPFAMTVEETVQGAFVSQDLMMATQLGRAEVERVNNMPYASMVSASFTNYQGYDYDVTRTVVYIQGNAASAESMKSITVDVRKAGSPTVLASFVTYFARNINYGL